MNVWSSSCVEISWIGTQQRQIYTSQHSFERFSTRYHHLDAYHKFDPITTNEDELRFLQAAEIKASGRTCVLWYGFSSHCRMAGWFRFWNIGVVSNHLIAGTSSILETVGVFSLLRTFQKDRCSQTRSCIMVGSDNRWAVKAVQIISRAMKEIL